MTPPPTDPLGLEGTTLGEKYAVGPAIARGGFGVVYRARHLEIDAPVALKVLVGLEHFGGAARDELVELFRQEARTLASLNHPSLARVLDFGTLRRGSGDVPWMALDWIDGRTLEDVLRERAGEGYGPREALDLLRPAFEALACAHAAGVSHRDLKPSNLMVVRPRPGESPLRVIDFGVAKVAPDLAPAGSGATATRSDLSAFSTLYAAPEQLARTRTGPWTDVHALALLLTELVTGARAYRSVDGAGLLQEVVGPERPTPGRRGAAVGPWEVVLERALSISPNDRPADAARLLRELESCGAEAQQAWASSPRAAARTSPPELAVTAVEPAGAPSAPRPDPATTARVPMRPRRLPWAVAIAALALAAAVLSLRARTSPHPTVVRSAVAAPRVTVPPAAPPAPVVTPPVVAPTPPVVGPAVRVVRAPSRPPPVARPAAATSDVPAVARPAVPFVAVE